MTLCAARRGKIENRQVMPIRCPFGKPSLETKARRDILSLVSVSITVLSSGSGGNATVLTGGRTRLLVDCGLSCREICRRLSEQAIAPESLDGILITHEHSDHVSGV